jgi:hypothetical protein
MPYYIELTCRIEDELVFRPFGLSVISKSTRTIVLAGRIEALDIVGRLRTVDVPFRGFRSCDEHTDPVVLISNGRELITLPTTTGDLRPYAALDRTGLAAIHDVLASQRYYELVDELIETFSE